MWVFQRLRSLICPELNVSACRRREKLPVATVTCRSDQSRGSGNFSREHFDNFQERAAAAAHQSRGARNPSEQIQDPGAGPGSWICPLSQADPGSARSVLLSKSALHRFLVNNNANFFSWPWFVSLKVVSMTTDALKGMKV